MVNQTQPSIEHIVLERRLSQISGSQISGNGINGNGNGDFGPETNDTKFSRSPRSSSIRRRSEMPNPGVPVVVNVPMPQLQVKSNLTIRNFLVTLKLFLNAKSSLLQTLNQSTI